jgi:hypothetical protein
MRAAPAAAALLLALVLHACAPSAPDAATERGGGPAPSSSLRPILTEPAPEPAPEADAATAPGAATGPQTTAAARPDWLGTRVLPLAADGFGQRLPTPAELVDRRLVTPPLPEPAPPRPAGTGFASSITAVPDDVLARSTWTADCPVSVDDLRYVTVHFFGFDGLVHAGELIVHADVADDIVTVFAALHAARFPLEEVRVIARQELDAPATGDGNVTSAFVCRPTVGGSRWSDHAFGRAVDLNPFHNPYVRGDLVIPELASAYVDRSDIRPGMIVPGDPVTEVFARVGWGWGGDWTGAATDPMHFSVSGR